MQAGPLGEDGICLVVVKEPCPMVLSDRLTPLRESGWQAAYAQLLRHSLPQTLNPSAFGVTRTTPLGDHFGSIMTCKHLIGLTKKIVKPHFGNCHTRIQTAGLGSGGRWGGSL